MKHVAIAFIGILAIGALGTAATAEYVNETTILETGASQGANLGQSVAMYGDDAVAGAPYEDNTGALYRFTRADGLFGNGARLVGAGAEVYDMFGQSAALSGDTLMVGAPGENEYNGGVYVYSDFGEQHFAGASQGGHFGESVEVDGYLGAAGAPYGNAETGEVYTFSKSESAWIQNDPIYPEGATGGDMFGQSVAICGNILVVGAPYFNGMGAVFVYEMTGNKSTQIALLTGDGEMGYFGHKADVYNGTILVSAPMENAETGSAYFFEQVGNVWVRTAKFNGNVSPGYYGWSAALEGNTAVVGAKWHNDTVGSAFVYHRARGAWGFATELLPSNGTQGDEFGWSVALSGGAVLAGAPAHDNYTGAVYVFEGLAAPDSSGTTLEALPGVDGVLLRWPPNTDITIQGYNVYREGGLTKYGDLLNGDGPITATTYLDTTAMAGVAYTYTILAVLEDGSEVLHAGPASVVAGRIAMRLGGVSNEGGANIMAPVSVSNAAGVGRQHMVFTIAYPAELIDGEVGVTPAALTADVNFTIETIGYGVVQVTGDKPGDTTPLAGDGPLCYLTMTLRGNLEPPQCGSLSFLPEVGAFLNDPAGEALDVDYSAQGWVCINPDCILGDLDYNTLVQIPDAQIITDIKVGLRAPDDCQRYSGDLNADIRIDSADAVLVLRMARGFSIVPGADDPFALPQIFEEGGQITLGADTIGVAPGEGAVVPLRIDDATGLAAFSLTLNFPPELSLDLVTIGDLDDSFTITTRMSSLGSASLSGGTDTGLPVENISGVVANLHFSLAEGVTAGTVLPIALAGAQLTSVFGEDFAWYAEVITEDGAVNVEEKEEGEGEDEPLCCCNTGGKQLPSAADLFLAVLSVAALFSWRRGIAPRVR